MTKVPRAITCESFRSWNRLEVRPREEDFEDVLKAEIYDPLWMIARQWQFGEFKGEDTGSAIMAKVEMRSSHLSKFQFPNGDLSPYNEEIPLETQVEAIPYEFDYKTRVSIGNQWFKMLKSKGLCVKYKQLFIQAYSIDLPQIEENDPEAKVVKKAQILSNPEACQFIASSHGRAMDGIDFYMELVKLNQTFSSAISPAIQVDINTMNQLIPSFIDWVESLYYFPKSEDANCWNPKQLEYEFACSIADESLDSTVLKVDEYYHGRLDWYAFDIESQKKKGQLGSNTLAEYSKKSHVKTFGVMPTAAQFGGIPNKRWWEFEDGKVDLGNIQADEKNLAKILLAEYALVYSNDWLILPYPVSVGTVSEVNGIIVTDVFGQKTLIEPANKGNAKNWNRWNMFNHTVLPNAHTEDSELDSRIFIPPSVCKVQESKPIEAVTFVRDEMANLIYAIETRISDMLGSGSSAYDAARYLVDFLQENYPQEIAEESNEDYELDYKIASHIPENWIPFIPVYLNNEVRSIQLQRASMPRSIVGISQDTPGPVRPRTALLRSGIDEDNTQNSPYFIFEEEIPKTGIQVVSSYQRTRWFNGKTFNWFGRRKTSGRGEGSSGLIFDVIKELEDVK